MVSDKGGLVVWYAMPNSIPKKALYSYNPQAHTYMYTRSSQLQNTTTYTKVALYTTHIQPNTVLSDFTLARYSYHACNFT